MSHVVTARYMHEAEPILYWRVKRGGKWFFQRTRFAIVGPGLYAVEPPLIAIDTEEE